MGVWLGPRRHRAFGRMESGWEERGDWFSEELALMVQGVFPYRRALPQSHPPSTATPTTSPTWTCGSSRPRLLKRPPHPRPLWRPLLPAPLLNPWLNFQLSPQLSRRSPRLCHLPRPLNQPGPSPEPGRLRKAKTPGPLASRSGRGCAGSVSGCC